MSDQIQLIECPRDAMQGIHEWIPTEDKVRYADALLGVGFHSLDFGSFVSPKAIPQMRDTTRVYEQMDRSESATRLLAIVANERGARDAVQHEDIVYLGYPFSISETFQLRNTQATIEESVERVRQISAIADAGSKELVIYISMGFGNPYGDPWNAQIAIDWVAQLYALGVRIFSLSDTIGVSTPDSIKYLFSHLIHAYEDVTFGAHLHTQPQSWQEKVEAALEVGCRRFDGALRGYGGCPMATDKLTGNMPMENMVHYFDQQGMNHGIDIDAMHRAMEIATEIFPIASHYG